MVGTGAPGGMPACEHSAGVCAVDCDDGGGGVAISWTISKRFAITALVLWPMGCAYNIKPLRTKDVPYLDVLTESVNNPLRLLGWYRVTSFLVPTLSLLMC